MPATVANIEQHFWSGTEVTAGGCIEWQRALNAYGYGVLRYKNKNYMAHRFAWGIIIGTIGNFDLDHLCRNHKCVNPEHLEPVTRQENLLRGDTTTARNAAKTHCPRGHQYTNSNTYHRKSGARICRTCTLERMRRYTSRYVRIIEENEPDLVGLFEKRNIRS